MGKSTLFSRRLDFAKVPDVTSQSEGLAKLLCLMKMCLRGKSSFLPRQAGNPRGLGPAGMPLQVHTAFSFLYTPLLFKWQFNIYCLFFKGSYAKPCSEMGKRRAGDGPKHPSMDHLPEAVFNLSILFFSGTEGLVLIFSEILNRAGAQLHLPAAQLHLPANPHQGFIFSRHTGRGPEPANTHKV